MPGAMRSSRRSVPDIWPGFVDAISTLLIIVIFLLMVFTLAQYFLGEILSGRNEALERLNRQMAELGQMLALERDTNADLRNDLAQISAELQSSVAARETLSGRVAVLETEREQFGARIDALVAERDDLRATLEETRKTVEADREKITVQLATIESLRRDTEALKKLRAELESQVGALASKLKQRDEALGAERDRSKALQSKLASEEERTLLAQKKIEEKDLRLDSLTGQLSARATELTEEQKVSSEARQRIALLNRQMEALRQQLARLSAALESSEAKAKEQNVQIVNLGRRLNAALASKVEELARYRSEFFGRLRAALGDRKDIRIVGDRFVFQSEVLFDSGQGSLAEGGQAQIDQLAVALKDIAAKIPKDLDWILRVDGHTDERPISNAQFASNWELSSARAISVVKRLIALGLPPDRLVAAGFGEYQPMEDGHNQAAWRRNRRIEFKLTTR